MENQGIPVDDLFTHISPHQATAQKPKDVHFTDPGYERLGRQVAASIEASLESK
ncbi:MAG: hypothetical protein WC765_11180 [Phycisphaerae bacterium]|jgi:lysophospholipase L1-like esterase